MVGNGVALCTQFQAGSDPMENLALPDAAAIARLGQVAKARGQVVDAMHAQPLYLRNKIALTTAERLAKASA
jgi:tRNA threonylcarbamoyladenosine biosynthesis protein TsaB